jgi:hypothetical protein
MEFKEPHFGKRKWVIPRQVSHLPEVTSQNFMKFGILSYTYEKGKNPKFHISVTSGHRAVRS